MILKVNDETHLIAKTLLSWKYYERIVDCGL